MKSKSKELEGSMNLDKKQTALVLAGLRMLQTEMSENGPRYLGDTILAILDDGGVAEGAIDEIDTLCEAINGRPSNTTKSMLGKAGAKKQVIEQVVNRLLGETIAYCDAHGVIGFGPKIPRGQLEITRGDDKVVRDLMMATARHAYDNKTLLVPGVPEAPDQSAGIDALLAFTKWINRKRMKK